MYKRNYFIFNSYRKDKTIPTARVLHLVMVNFPKEYQFKRKFTILQLLTGVNSWVHLWTKLLTASSTEEFKRQCLNRGEGNKNNSITPKINITKFRMRLINSNRISMCHHLAEGNLNVTRSFRCLLHFQSINTSLINSRFSHRE